MADEQHEVRQVSWTEVFSFTHIFKSRKLAMHPSKLVLALALIALVCLGGWVFDLVWSIGGSYVNTADGEIAAFTSMRPETFDKMMDHWKSTRVDNAADLWAQWATQAAKPTILPNRLPAGPVENLFSKKLRDVGAGKTVQPPDLQKAKEEGTWRSLLSDAENSFGKAIAQAHRLLADSYSEAPDKETTGDSEKLAKKLKDIEANYEACLQNLVALQQAFDRRAEDIRGEGIFTSFIDFQTACVQNAIYSIGHGNLTGGLKQLVTSRQAPKAESPLDGTPLAFPVYEDKAGFLYYVMMSFHGVRWLFVQHIVFALIFGVYVLSLWALLGGAIYRIAALHAAREEKTSIGQALRFSAGKFLSFLMAPVIPLGVILLIGAVLALGGLIANAMGAGALVMGVLFFLAIIAGLVIAFLLFGLVGGASLMYPTIAVEGSDSFDAMSRSYSYIFNRPWRAGVYAVSALVHGTICYLFVRLFAFVALKATHLGVETGVWTGGRTVAGASDKLDVMWPTPSFEAFHAPINTPAMSTMETLGACAIAVWVYVIIGVVAAFLISYFISASTVTYFLLRRHVDATDLDDVFVDETEEQEFPAEAPAEDPAPTPDDQPAPEGDSSE